VDDVVKEDGGGGCQVVHDFSSFFRFFRFFFLLGCSTTLSSFKRVVEELFSWEE